MYELFAGYLRTNWYIVKSCILRQGMPKTNFEEQNNKHTNINFSFLKHEQQDIIILLIYANFEK